MVKPKSDIIVRVCWAWRDDSGELHEEWGYEIIHNKKQLEKLKTKWYDVKIVGKVINDKHFVKGDLTRTCYRVMKCETGETFIEKLRVESGVWWYIIVKSDDVQFEDINSFEESAIAFRDAYVKKYPAHCTVLYP